MYVGNLPRDITEKELDNMFYKFGKISRIEIKDNGSKPFAFVEFDDRRDCEDAIKEKDGYNYDGYRLQVELPREESRRRRSRSRSPRRDRKPRGEFNDYGKPTFNKTRTGPSKRTEYRIVVTGIPRSGSWQDLKDHMREAGDVSFTDVLREGDDNVGIVEFFNKEDMNYAVDKLDGTEFKSHEGEKCKIYVDEDKDDKYKDATSRDFERRGGFEARRRPRSRSPPRRRSRSRSPPKRDYRGRSVSRSRSRSPGYRR